MAYEIIPYRPEFKDQVVRLQGELWRQDAARDAAYFKWKYEDNPYLETPMLYLALHEAKVVGVRGLFGAKWQIGSPQTELLVPCNTDTVVAPEHRQGGLYHNLTKYLINDLSGMGFTYVFNFKPSRVNFVNSMMLGWRRIGSYRPMTRRTVLAGRRYRLRHWILKQPALAAAARRGKLVVENAVTRLSADRAENSGHGFQALDDYGRRCRSDSYTQLSIEATARPAAMAQLIDRIGSDGRMRHIRDEQYFAWRFNNPHSHYRFVFWGKEQLEGYLVLQQARTRLFAKVRIIDWEGTSDEVRAKLLHAVVESGNFTELSVWSSTLSDQTKQLLQDAGFSLGEETQRRTDSDSAPIPIMRGLDHDKPPEEWRVAGMCLLDIANWDMRAVYPDAY
ncbi:MAG: GNAT family N-acetyltransferase [Rhodospirillales bacterium]|nr:GNAT family N-acetyltransferase [Rhodospirillales bacterium]